MHVHAVHATGYISMRGFYNLALGRCGFRKTVLLAFLTLKLTISLMPFNGAGLISLGLFEEQVYVCIVRVIEKANR